MDFFFITLFSLSSDIQGVGEGHPPVCLTNYKYGILMVGTLAHFFRSSIMHLKAITKQLYTTMKVPFSLHFNFLMDFVLV